MESKTRNAPPVDGRRGAKQKSQRARESSNHKSSGSGRKPRPPYSSLLMKCPPMHGIAIHCGYHAWGRAKYWNRNKSGNLVLPDAASPADFDWTVCKDEEVAVVHNHYGDIPLDTHTLNHLAQIIIKAGANRVVVADPRFSLQVYAPAPGRGYER